MKGIKSSVYKIVNGIKHFICYLVLSFKWVDIVVAIFCIIGIIFLFGKLLN